MVVGDSAQPRSQLHSQPRGLLRYRADRRSIGLVSAYGVLAITGWLFVRPSSWMVVPWVAVTCMSAWIVGVVTHNSIHTPVFRSRALNRAFQLWLSLSYGWPVSEFGPGHNLSHHKHMQKGGDLMRTTKVRSRSNLWNLICFAPLVAAAVMAANYSFSARARTTARAWYRQLMFETAVVWAVKITLLVVDWKRALLFVIIPHVYAVWGMVGVNYLWHDGCDEDHPYNHSRNFVGPVFNYFTLNNGFHTIHHERPGMHWSLAPAEHARLVHPHIHPALEQRSFLAYIFVTFIWPGRRMRYDGAPLDVVVNPPDEPFLPAPSEMRELELPGA